MAKRNATGDNRPATTPTGDVHPKKERAAFYLPVEVIDRANRAAYWQRMTVSDVAAEALNEYLNRAEKKEGSPFKPAPPLRRGRPAIAR